MTTQKMQEVFNSTNFLTALLTSIFLLFQASGADIEDPMRLAQIITETGVLLSINLVQPVLKFLRNGSINIIKAFTDSPNFRTQLATIIIQLLLLFGLQVDENAISGILDAIPGGNFSVIITNLGIVVWNIISRLRTPAKILPQG